MSNLYIKKPISVLAFQWNGESRFNPVRGFEPVIKQDHPDQYQLYTAEGWMNLKNGSYIVKEQFGEYWAVREDIFLVTYEKVQLDSSCKKALMKSGAQYYPRTCPSCGLSNICKKGL